MEHKLVLDVDEMYIMESLKEQLDIEKIDFKNVPGRRILKFDCDDDLERAVDIKNNLINNYEELQAQTKKTNNKYIIEHQNEAKQKLEREIREKQIENQLLQEMGIKVREKNTTPKISFKERLQDEEYRKNQLAYLAEKINCDICNKTMARSSHARHKRTLEHKNNTKTQDKNLLLKINKYIDMQLNKEIKDTNEDMI